MKAKSEVLLAFDTRQVSKMKKNLHTSCLLALLIYQGCLGIINLFREVLKSFSYFILDLS
jgi:hypothetical protein